MALVILVSRNVHAYVLDITLNFMLNKRKSKKKRLELAKPQTPLGELSALPQTPLLSREGARPLPYPPVMKIFIGYPLSQYPGSAPELVGIIISHPFILMAINCQYSNRIAAASSLHEQVILPRWPMIQL